MFSAVDCGSALEETGWGRRRSDASPLACRRLAAARPAIRDLSRAAFIENLIAWRRECVARLLQPITDVVETDPVEALAATNEFAEYVLYGVFCEGVLTLEGSGHFASPVPLCRTAWARGGLKGVDALLEGSPFLPEQVAVGIQSTLPMGVPERRAIVRRLTHRISS